MEGLYTLTAPELPGLQLVNSTISSWEGQIIYLDFDGEQNVTYNGPVTVGPFDVPAFSLDGSALAGQEGAVITEVLRQLQRTFAGSGIIFTTEQPEQTEHYSTIWIGGDDSSFSAYGSFRGLAENVDVGNAALSDDAFIFTDQFLSAFAGSDDLIAQLSQTIAHEAGHLLGYAHSTVADHLVQSPVLFEVAAAEVTVLGYGMSINNNDTTPSTGDGTDFGTAVLDGTTLSSWFQVWNDGDSTLTLGPVTVPAGFAVDTAYWRSSLAPGTRCYLHVSVEPTTAGVWSGDVSFATGDLDENPFSFRVTASVTRPAGPEIKVLANGLSIEDGNPDTLQVYYFPTVVQGGTPSSRTFTVQNDGSSVLTLGPLVVPGGFTVTEGLSASLATGESDTFTIRLDTTEVGDKGGDVSFTNNDADENPFNFEIAGTVQTPTAEITVLYNGNSLPNMYGPTVVYGTLFGDVVQGQPPVSRTWTVRNDGTATLTLGSVTVPMGYTLIEGLPASLAPGASDTFTVQFDIVTLGTHYGLVSIPTNDSNENPFNLRIAGVVIPDWGPEITVLGNNISIRDGDATPEYADATNIGGGVVGGPATWREFTVRNDGTSTLMLGPITVPSGFTVAEGLPATLAPDQSDTFRIAIDMEIVGTKIGDVSIANNDSDENPFEFRVTGKVLPPPEITVLWEGVVIADGDTTPSTADGTDFGNANLDGMPVYRTFVIRNDGGSHLVVDAINVPSGFEKTTPWTVWELMPPGSIAPGGITTFSVRMRTDVEGVKSGEISIVNGDADQNPFTFRITGEVLDGAVIPAPVEQFTGGSDTFDLANTRIMFTPAEAGYTFAVRWTGELPTDPTGSTALTLPDNWYVNVSLGSGKTVALYGQSYGSFYVGSNGYLTFTQSDTDYSESWADHFDTPRISALFDDLDPSAGGQVSWKQLSDRVVVTWEAVPEVGTAGLNTMQVEMYFDGRIQLAWLVVASQDGIVGLSNGLGLPGGFTETNFREPGITVLGAGTTIADGDTTPSATDLTDFGTAAGPGSPVSHTFFVRNDGMATLTLGVPTVPTGFTLTESPRTSLGPGGGVYTTFTVRLDATIPGVKSGDISFSTNDPGANPFNFRITGTVIAAPETVVYYGGGYLVSDGDTTPEVINGTDFGLVALGPAVSHTFAVHNNGNATLTLGALTVPTGFFLTEGLASSIAPGSSDTFTIQVDTATTGTKNGTISFTTNDPDRTLYDFLIDATVIIPPEITVSYDGIVIADGDVTPSTTDGTDFGSVVEDSPPVVRVFTVRNDGGSPLTLGGVTVPSSYALTDGLLPSLPPGMSDTFTVVLNTGAPVTRTGSIWFSTGDSDENPFDFVIRGTVMALPDIRVFGNGYLIDDGDTAPSSTTHTDFGIVVQGGLGRERTFQVHNNGGSTLTLGAVTVPTGYTVTEGLPASLAAGAWDAFTVRLDTVTEGIKAGDISFSTNDPDENPFNFLITGQVNPALPEITVLGDGVPITDGDTIPGTGDETDFGTVTQGDTGRTRVFLVRNNGGAALTLGPVIVPTGFTLTEGLSSSLAAGAWDTFAVHLDSVTTGTKSGAISFSTNDADENPFDFWITGQVIPAVQEIAVVGNGVEISDGDGIPSTSDWTDFGSVAQGSAGVSRVFGVRNDGTATLTLGAITIPAGFTLMGGLSASLAPGNSDAFTVRLDTATLGIKSGDISFSTNDADENPFNFRITGQVIPAAPDITVLGNGYSIPDGDSTPSTGHWTDFGSVAQGGAGITRVFTVRNDGTAALTLGSVTIPVGYTLMEGLSASLAVGASDTFTVQLDTAMTGTKTGDVSIATNDPDENPFNFRITGRVMGILAQTVPYSQNFSLGKPGIAQGWEYYSDAEGRIDVVSGQLRMDDTTDNFVYSLNEAILHVNLMGQMGVTLRLDHTSLSDESTSLPASFDGHFNGDGIALSVDGGNHWITVADLTTSFTGRVFDLDPVIAQAVAAAGGSANLADVQIKFQQYDNWAAPNNGRELDNIQVLSALSIPEIEVTGNGQVIGDNDLVPSVADGTDFGSVAQDGGVITRMFAVHNEGAAILTPGTVMVPVGYTLTEGLPSSLAPGDWDTFTVRLDTATLGIKSGDISFSTNDADENPFNFRITGQVIPAAPDITVLGNGYSIPDGDSTPSAADGTDFGSVNRGGAAISHTFTVRNDGTAVLTLGAVTVPSGFTLTEGLSASLAVGAWDMFTVQLDTATAGTKRGDISFFTNDPDESPFNFRVTGTVLSPEVTVLGNGVSITDGDSTPSAADGTDFGSVVQGGAAITRTFTVRNDGTIILTLGTLMIPAGFTGTGGYSNSLVPGESTTLTVQLSTATVGTKSGDISFATNDLDENPFTFRITGAVVSAGGLAEQFTGGTDSFDLANKAILLTPSGSGYSFAARPITALPTDPAGGTALTLGDDSSVPVTVGSGQTVVLYGQSYGSFYVGSNGYITFTEPDTAYSESLAGHFSTPRISVLFDDLNPTAGGQVRWRQLSDRVVVTWAAVADYGTSNPNTMQVEMYFDGRIQLAWLGVASPDAIVGLSNGLGLPGGFTETDLSASVLPAPEVTVLGNGVSITDEDSTPSTSDWTDFGSVVQGGTGISRTFTVRNDGTATLTLGAVTVPAGYTLTEGLSASLAPGASDTFTVQLDTAITGTKSGDISFSTNDPDENPFTFRISGQVILAGPEVTVLGNGVSITDGDSTPSTSDWTDFGSVVQGGATITRTFTVRNDGTAALTLGAVTVPAGYTLTEGLSASLAPGASDTFAVQLDTAITGTRSGDISFATNDSDENPYTFRISGQVTAAPTFPPAEQFTGGTDSFDLANKAILLTPSGSGYSFAARPITALPTDPAGGTALTLGDDSSVPVTVGSGQTVVLYGQSYGSFYVGSNGYITFTEPDTAYSESLAGHFSTPRISVLFDDLNPTAGGQVRWRQLSDRVVVTWAAVADYGTSNPNTMQVEMYFDGRIQLAWLGVASPDAIVGLSNGLGLPGGFTETDLSASVLPAPEVTVLGNGVSITDEDSTPSTSDWTDFGSVVQGGTGISRTFTVRNDGTATLTLGAVTVPAGYTLTEGLSASLAPGASDTFTVQLDTAITGTKSGDISFSTNDPDENPFTFRISGQVILAGPEVTVLGNGVSITDGDSTPSTSDWTDFGSVVQGGATITRTFTVRNDGTAALTLGAVTVPAGYTLTEGLSASLAPGASDTFAVQLDTAITGTRSGDISFATNDSDENPYTFRISGQVTAAPTFPPAEQFTGGTDSFDLANKAILLTPSGSGYSFAARPITALPTDPAGGTALTLGDDSSVPVTVGSGQTVVLYGQSYGSFYVGSNGYITFTEPDTAYSESLAGHFSTPRISVLFDDLNPTAGGQVRWRQLSDRVVVTWAAVADYGTSNPNTMQVEMYFDGRIQLAWLGVASPDAIVGLSNGLGLPGGFTETDLSASVLPAPEVTVLGNGVSITDEDSTPSTSDWTDFGSVVQGGTGISRTFTVRNDGTATLTLGAVTVPAGYTLTEGLSASLAPGASDTFTVQLDTATVGVKSGDVSFVTNDSDENPFNFRITGQVMLAGPEVTVLGNGVSITDGDTTPATADWTDFGSVAQGGTGISRTFTVRNDGTATLTLGAITVPAGYTLTEGLSASLATGASDTFTVQLDTAIVGTKSGDITFTTNDSDENPFNFRITGQVTGASMFPPAEQFTGGTDSFDLANTAILFTPGGSGYTFTRRSITELPTDPTGGTGLTLGDDSSVGVSLGSGKTVVLYGQSYGSFYVGSNGYITFTQSDTDYSETLADHFDAPRISVLFDDLNPSASGQVSWRQLSDRVVVTWEAVADYGTGDPNTMQVEMYFDGRIQLAWLGVATPDAIVGLSDGLGLPGGFTETDLSAGGL